ncbi:MAG: hypothetical protein ACRET4_06405, partial [Steroidobacteraceae bacterium]
PASPLGRAPVAPAAPPTPLGAPAPAGGDIHLTAAFGTTAGTKFSIVCIPDEYVVGFVGTSGAWFDQLTIACARWNSATNTIGGFHPLGERAGTSSGGKPNYSYCNGGTAVNRLAIQMMMEDAPHMVLDNIQFDCANLASPHAVEETDVIATQEDSDYGFNIQRAEGNFKCNPGEFAVGIYGYADQFIHRLGLQCRAAPIASAVTPSLSTRMRTTHDIVPPPPGPMGHGGRALATNNLDWDSANAPTTLPINPRPTPSGGPARPPGDAGPSAGPTGSTSQPPFDLPNGATPPVTVRNGVRFNFPHVRARDGKTSLLDSCYAGTATCGQPVANAFCRVSQSRTSAVAVEYKTFRGTGRDGRTAALPTNAVCTGKACSGFLYVVCKS